MNDEEKNLARGETASAPDGEASSAVETRSSAIAQIAKISDIQAGRPAKGGKGFCINLLLRLDDGGAAVLSLSSEDLHRMVDLAGTLLTQRPLGPT